VQDPLETVTEYVPLVVTGIDCVVAPVDQVFPVVEEDVNVTVLPRQIVVEPLDVTTGVAGTAFTVTVVGNDVEEHVPFDTDTVYVPELVTVILWEVALFDHVFPVAEDEVSTTEPPEQKVVAPFGAIVGVAGGLTTVTVTGCDVAEHPDAPTDTV
jgi:hypothetical protein